MNIMNKIRSLVEYRMTWYIAGIGDAVLICAVIYFFC